MISHPKILYYSKASIAGQPTGKLVAKVALSAANQRDCYKSNSIAGQPTGKLVVKVAV